MLPKCLEINPRPSRVDGGRACFAGSPPQVSKIGTGGEVGPAVQDKGLDRLLLQWESEWECYYYNGLRMVGRTQWPDTLAAGLYNGTTIRRRARLLRSCC